MQFVDTAKGQWPLENDLPLAELPSFIKGGQCKGDEKCKCRQHRIGTLYEEGDCCPFTTNEQCEVNPGPATVGGSMTLQKVAARDR